MAMEQDITPTKVRPCIVWGATGQAKVVHDILRLERIPIIHFFDNNSRVPSPLSGIPIAHGLAGLQMFIENLPRLGLTPADLDCVAAIGGGHGLARQQISEMMQGQGFVARSVIHQAAIISPLARLGAAIQIMAGAIVGPHATIGNHTIINSGANVDHDCTIGHACHLAPRAALAGEVICDDQVFIGTNATILPRLRIGRGSTVGAGAVVTRDVQAGVIVVGNPARVMVN